MQKRAVVPLVFLFIILVSMIKLEVPFLEAAPPASSDSNTWQVSLATDDCLRRITSSAWDTASTYLPAGDNTAGTYDYSAGMRFLNITIPQGAVISNARLTLRAESAPAGSIGLTYLLGEDVDNSVTFTTSANYDGRVRTTANVSWTPAAWVQDTWYNSTDIQSIIQEIVNRGGWASGNNLTIFWSDSPGWQGVQDILGAQCYDDGAAVAPQLVVEWTEAWPYDTDIFINSASGAGVSYPIQITVIYGAGINNGSTVYMDSNCRTDFNDLRFMASNESTLLAHYKEYFVSGVYAYFWFSCPDDLSTTSSTVVLFYGNPSASTDLSDGDAVFGILFDDFEASQGYVAGNIEGQQGWANDTGISEYPGTWIGNSSTGAFYDAIHGAWSVVQNETFFAMNAANYYKKFDTPPSSLSLTVYTIKNDTDPLYSWYPALNLKNPTNITVSTFVMFNQSKLLHTIPGVDQWDTIGAAANNTWYRVECEFDHVNDLARFRQTTLGSPSKGTWTAWRAQKNAWTTMPLIGILGTVGYAACATDNLLVGDFVYPSPEVETGNIITKTCYSTLDGFVVGTNTTYNDAWTDPELVDETGCPIGQRKWPSAYSIYRTFLRFDTSSVPNNCTISEAYLSLYGVSDYSNDDFLIQFQEWTGADNGLSTADYNANLTQTYDDGLFNTTDWNVNSYNNITFSNFSIINEVGYTDLVVRSSHDINNSTPPTGLEYVTTHDSDEGAGFWPILYITCLLGPNQNPTIGDFQPLGTIEQNGEGFFLNMTVQDLDGLNEITYVSINLEGSIYLKWANITDTFTEERDDSNFCTLNATTSNRTTINSTAYSFAWYITLSDAYSEGYKDVLIAGTNATDGQDTTWGNYDDLFWFDLKEWLPVETWQLMLQGKLWNVAEQWTMTFMSKQWELVEQWLIAVGYPVPFSTGMLRACMFIGGIGMFFMPLFIMFKKRPSPDKTVILFMIMIIGFALVLGFIYMGG